MNPPKIPCGSCALGVAEAAAVSVGTHAFQDLGNELQVFAGGECQGAWVGRRQHLSHREGGGLRGFLR